MDTQTLKTYIKNTCKIPAVGIAPVDDLTLQEINAVQETNRIMATYSPVYSQDTPVFQPKDFLDSARAIIILGLNFFFERKKLPGNPPRSEIMNFYVNPECLNYVVSRTDSVVSYLAEQGYEAMSVPTGIPQKMMAAKSGIGRYGKNAVIQCKALGSWIGIALVITNAPLQPDTPADEDCGDCTLCQEACPTGALDKPYECNIERCLTLQMVNNKGSLPYDIREKAGTCIAHCNICLDVCPKNKNLQAQTGFSNPEDMVYPLIAPLVNMTEEMFQERFGGTFLEYTIMDRKYIQRNAAVALGNFGDPAYLPVLMEALEAQPEEMVRGHAAWAIGKIGGKQALACLEQSIETEISEPVLEEIRYALDRIKSKS